MSIDFENVRVPAENSLTQESQGFKVIMNNFNSQRMGMSARMNSAAKVCFEDAVKWLKEGNIFVKGLADHHVIRHKIAEMMRDLTARQIGL